MMTEEPAQLLLPDLPDPCLLTVLQLCAADDQRSVLSAARAHSRLHRAAVAALHRITVNVAQQHHTDSVLMYLTKHGQHVESFQIKGHIAIDSTICQLPPNLQLSSLQLEGVCMQLQPGHGFKGVLGAVAGGAALKHLELRKCRVAPPLAKQWCPPNQLSSDGELAAALSQLPALEHLSISFSGHRGLLSLGTLQLLQQLTYLELTSGIVLVTHGGAPVLGPMQALTRLVDLRLGCLMAADVAVAIVSMLSGTQHLTRLDCSGLFEPDLLAGKTRLQHLCFPSLSVLGGAAGEGQLMSCLQHLQQLTHLDLSDNLREAGHSNLPAAAYSALTASSKLQYLGIRGCMLPAGVWQHLFAAGRQLPHLTSLQARGVLQPSGDGALAPEGGLLVSCCPNLQDLNIDCLECHAELLPPLQGLSKLHTLRFSAVHGAGPEAVQAVCRLTGLRQLAVNVLDSPEELLLQLTQLRCLTWLYYAGPVDNANRYFQFVSKDPSDEPVWRQVLCVHLDHSDLEMAQQAAAALAE